MHKLPVIGALGFPLLFLPCAGVAGAQQIAGQPQGVDVAAPPFPPASPSPEGGAHRFWDKTNVGLFSAVAAVRALDYTSTRHFRALGREELLFSNSYVDNRPLFAATEAAFAAASVGISYLLHRTGHHRAERWFSVVHIGAGAFGDTNNYFLERLTRTRGAP